MNKEENIIIDSTKIKNIIKQSFQEVKSKESVNKTKATIVNNIVEIMKQELKEDVN
jgi:hypothetical protein